MSYDHEPDYPEMDDFSMNISTMIEEEVRRRAAETVKNLEQSRKYNQELRRSLNEARSQIRAFDQEKAKLLKEKEIEVRREIFRGLNIGDKVFTINSKYEKHTCDKCTGNKNLQALIGDEQVMIRCPKCNGNGYISSSFYHPVEDVVESLHVEMNSRNKWTKFWLRKRDAQVNGDDIFKTLEECQAYCDERNKPKAIESNESA